MIATGSPARGSRLSRRLALALILVAGPLLGACELFEPGPRYAAVSGTPVPPERARLVIYRPAATHLLGVVGDRAVAIDGAPVCGLADGQFFIHDAPAGATSISDGTSRLDVAAAPGGQYFVRIAFNPHRASFVGWVPPVLGFGPEQQTPESGLFAIETVDPAKAAVELAGLWLDPACR
jgi:hypothetical protein